MERPVIPNAIVNNSMSLEEQFQNEVIRPVIKARHKMLIRAIAAYMAKNNVNFDQKVKSEKINYISSVVSKDIAFRNMLTGMISGNLTDEEYSTYLTLNGQDINKRILSILTERFHTNLEEITLYLNSAL